MALSGKQKAAVLLMSLDAATAAELVKGLDDNVVDELANELSYLNATDFKSDGRSSKIVRQFHNSLETRETFRLNTFLYEVLKSTVGQEKAGSIQTQIQDLLCNRDPFVSICSVDSRTLAFVLGKEHPQTIAVVLSELPAQKKHQVLSLLDGSIQVSVVARMGDCNAMTAEEKALVAEEICRRLNPVAIENTGKPLQSYSEQSLREVALIVRGFDKEIRDGLLGTIHDKDHRAGEMVAELMIIWADIPQVTDKSLREALNRVDVNTIALALHKASEEITNKIRSVFAEQIVAIDEQALCISALGQEDIDKARERIIRVLRRMNDQNELVFIDEGSEVYDIVG
jgi:flagellar motor switch protein FliG